MNPSYPSSPSGTGQLARRTQAPAGSLPGATPWRRHLVMVIDDSPAVRRVVAAVCSRAGMDAVAYPDGITAINALAGGDAAVPDIVLLDIGLPKMDGYEVAHILRANPGFDTTRIIMLTGHDGVMDRVRSKLAGANGFVAKPFRCADLVRYVQAYLRHHSPMDGSL